MMKPSIQDRFFPQRGYHPAVLVLGMALALGFWGLEATLHSGRAAAVPEPSVLLRAVWDGAYYLSYLWYLLPLALPAMWIRPGTLRRLIVGLGLVLSVGAGLAAAPWRIALLPCLNMASAFLVLGVAKRSTIFSVEAFSAFIAAVVGLAKLQSGRHEMDALAIGVILGLAAYWIAFSKNLGFLDDAKPWDGINFELSNLRNLVVGNRRASWEDTYAAGQGSSLRAPHQRARHYAIAGLVGDLFPGGAAILDVGCGYGTLWEQVSPRAMSYVGLDLSSEVVGECRRSFSADSRCSFVQADFEAYPAIGEFDVVVLNEVLYYFPLRRVDAIMSRAFAQLRPGGVVIVSMNRNFKARWLWWCLRGGAPARSLRVENLDTGSYWTVKVYAKSGAHPI
jgi:SAM-dependent methyltransferase